MAAVRPIELSLTVSPVRQACYDNVECKQRPIASASLTCCGQYGIIMLGHNMLCVSRVRTDNRTLLSAPPHPWITQSQSQCDSPHYDATAYIHGPIMDPMSNSIRSPPSFVLSIKAIVCRTIPVNCRFSVSGVTVQYIVEQLIN